MKLLAVDQSYTSSGLIVFENERMIHAERFCSNTELNMFDRAWEVSLKVRKLAKDWGVEAVALEGLAFSKFGNATRDLAGLQYTIINTLVHLDGQKVIVVPPNTVKKVATGKGNAKKEQLLECLPDAIRSHFEDKLDAKKTKGLYDLTDAYWIGIAANKITSEV